MPSSTSSSRDLRLPLALLGAVALLLCCELGLRWSHRGQMLPYRMSPTAYHFLPVLLRERGAAEVAIVGSSRGREGFVSPRLAQQLEARTGQGRSVANYSIASGRAAEADLLLRNLLRAEPSPKIVIYGVTPRQLLEREHPYEARAQLLRLSDLWSDWRTPGIQGPPPLGPALRNSLSDHLYLFRYEHEIRRALSYKHGSPKALVRTLLGQRGSTLKSPMLGDPSEWQRKKPKQSVPITPERVQRYVQNVTKGKPYTVGEEQQYWYRRSLERLKGDGVQVFVVELPMSELLLAELPPGLMEACRKVYREGAEEHGARFIPLSRLNLELLPSDWREQSHLNLLGARKVSDAVAREITPFLPLKSPSKLR